MNKIKCDYCQSIITEFVSVNYIDYVTNKRVCEDRPFCSVCLEEDFEKTRVMGTIKPKEGEIINDSIHS